MNVGSLVDDAGNFFRAGHGVHQLSEEAVTGILAARRGVGPSESLVKALGEQGAIFTGGTGEVLAGAPKGESLIDAIRGRVDEQLFSLMNAWKDRNFPKRLEKALQQQEALLPKLRETLVTQQSAVRSGNQAIGEIEASIARLETKAKEAVAAGNDDLAGRLLGQKVGLKEQLTGITERAQKYAADVDTTKNQITTLEEKILIDRSKANTLLAEWELKKQLKDLAGDAKQAMQDLNNLEGDALKNARQADQATKAAQGAIDDLLGGGGVRVPGGGGSTPPTAPVVDDAVAKELQRIKDELKAGA